MVEVDVCVFNVQRSLVTTGRTPKTTKSAEPSNPMDSTIVVPHNTHMGSAHSLATLTPDRGCGFIHFRHAV